MRHLLLSALLLSSVPAAMPVAYAAALSSPADSSLLTERFTVDGNTAVPGTVLKNGTYVIRVVDHMSDRSILRIEDEKGKALSTFLGVPNASIGGGQGPVVWGGGSEHDRALRGFNFPGSFSVEFVYPKAEAVKIALSHSSQVNAIDPESDNLPSKEKNLTNDDMRMVTLWTLSPTKVDGKTPAIAAEKYKPAVQPVSAPPLVARNEPPAPLPPRATPSPSAASTRPSTSAAPAPVAPAARKPVARRALATALPHTASELPAVLLAGVVALFGLFSLRLRRFVAR